MWVCMPWFQTQTSPFKNFRVFNYALLSSFSWYINLYWLTNRATNVFVKVFFEILLNWFSLHLHSSQYRFYSMLWMLGRVYFDLCMLKKCISFLVSTFNLPYRDIPLSKWRLKKIMNCKHYGPWFSTGRASHQPPKPVTWWPKRKSQLSRFTFSIGLWLH